MEKVERILWRVVPVVKKFLIFSRTLSFAHLLYPTYLSWLLSFGSLRKYLLFPSPLSWPLFNYILSTFAYYSFTNPAILSWVLGSGETRKRISDLGFEHNIQILEGFGAMFYFDLCIPPLLMHKSCLAWFATLAAFCFSVRLQKSSDMKKQIQLIMRWWKDDAYEEEEEYGEELRIEEEEEAEDQLRIEEEDEEAEDQSRIEEANKAEDMEKWMVLKAREDEMKKEEEAEDQLRIEEEDEEAEDQLRIEEANKAEDMEQWMLLKAREDEMKKEDEAWREETMKKVMEKLKKEKEKHQGYRRKWEEEKEEKARLNGELCAATKWAEYCQTFLQIYEKERRKWEEERNELTAKLSAAQDSSDLYQQLLHECSSF